MTPLSVTVNGNEVQASVEPRTHLADFLREELLLTGTHLGCEHGVCGACTLLVDGEPVRSCIAFAADCAGRSVQTIEGLDKDPVTARLRSAFSAEHALQCGFCTPGMLVTARDIVLRLPNADEDRIRLELAGNLCRCTGYNGIVRAIKRVLAEPAADRTSVCRPVPTLALFEVEEASTVAQKVTAAENLGVPSAEAGGTKARGQRIVQRLTLASPVEEVWASLKDPALIATCVPGARLIDTGPPLKGEMLVALGPIKGLFQGEGALSYDDSRREGQLTATGRDQFTGTRMSADATFAARSAEDERSVIDLAIEYTLRGPLAQFGRGPVVQVFAAEIAAIVGQNLEARLRGEAPSHTPRQLGAAGLLARVVWTRLKALVGKA